MKKTIYITESLLYTRNEYNIEHQLYFNLKIHTYICVYICIHTHAYSKRKHRMLIKGEQSLYERGLHQEKNRGQ